MRKSGDRVTFLIVDDDDVAIMGMRRAIRKLDLANPVEVARNGAEALEMLRAGGEKGIEKPYVVTLDLNMPRMGGLQFLDEIRQDTSLHDAVIFVVTTSEAPTDIAAAYAKNIAGYIVKDNAYETLKSALGMLKAYMMVVRLPGSTPPRLMELRVV